MYKRRDYSSGFIIMFFLFLNLHIFFLRMSTTFPSFSIHSLSELQLAISYLNLPTWSRSHLPCWHPSSEISCDAITRAYTAVRDWEQRASPHNVVHATLDSLGLCNRAILDMTAIIIGMFTHSVVSVSARVQAGRRRWRKRNAYEYPPTGPISYNIGIEHYNGTHREILVTKFLDIIDWPSNGTHFMIHEPYMASLAYLHPILGPFIEERFGNHAQYFLLNYLFRFPNKVMTEVQTAIAPLPRTVRLFGIHLRWHKSRHFYLESINATMEVVVPFCKSLRRPTIFVLASDNRWMMEAFQERIPVFKLDIYRKSDGDHFTAILDLALLMMCDCFLGTARSTFSALVHLRTGKRPWLIEQAAKEIWRAGSSQI
jgi:hypothetical protein